MSSMGKKNAASMKFAKYLDGMGRVLIQLAKEVRQDGKLTSDSKDLAKKVGSNLLFNAVFTDFQKEFDL